jgi:signal transduction histidine kinase
LGSWIAPVANGLLTLALLVVPDGRLPSPRWRPLVWWVVGSAALGAASAALAPGTLANGRPNPFGVAEAAALVLPLRSWSRTFLLIGFAAAAGSLAVRFRGAAGGERQQLKWIACGSLIWVLATLVVRVRPPALTPFLGIVYLLGLLAFVAAVTVALLRHHLYDIDVLLSRAFLYGTLAGCITGTYVAVVAGVGALIGTRGEPNLILSLLATILVAVAFQPLRERVQRLANQLVYGQRSSPYEVLADLSRRMAGALSVDEVLPRLAEAAARGVGGLHSRATVYVGTDADRTAAWPARSASAGDAVSDAVSPASERTVSVRHRGEPVGTIAVAKPPGEPFTPAEVALLDDLAAQAGLAFSNVRLTEDLRASRQRIVAAQDAERRRIERDLHDGAQQHLVALAVNARLARELVRRAPDQAVELLGDVGAQADQALRALRDLARGIYPPILADKGIVAALEAQLARARLAARLETDLDDGTRYAPTVEAAVYFCVLEALQNAAKHAPDAPIRVRLDREDGWLQLTVADAGPGFDVARQRAGRAGSGLQGMADRLAATGGTLEVRSQPGHGTTVVGRVPAPPTPPTPAAPPAPAAPQAARPPAFAAA